MSYIEWSPKLETGISVIDSQHRVLIGMLNQIQAASTEKNIEMRSLVVKLNLQHLVEYTVYHFETEEKMLEECNFPGLVAHKKEHADLRVRVIDFVEQYNRGEEVMAVLLSFLKGWLQGHIQGTDMAYVPTLSKHLKK